MQITLIKQNQLNEFILPNKIAGTHWITDYENGKEINLINIEATTKGWKIISNNEAYLVGNQDVMIPSAILKEYSFFLIKNNYKNEKYYLYCSPVYDKTYKEISIKDKISVGSGKENNISYQLKGIPVKSFEIIKVDKYYYLSIVDNTSLVFVNQKRVLANKRLEYGDIIFCFGLKIILMRKDNIDYLLVNNPFNLLQFNSAIVNVVPIKDEFIEDNAELSNDTLYKEDNYFYRAPHFYKKLDPYTVNIDIPPAAKGEDKTPAILTVGPMLTMSMVSIIMMLSTFSSVKKGHQDFKSVLPSIVMSGAMLASCLLWPLLTRAYQKFINKKYEKKRQKQYRKYINKLDTEIEQELKIQSQSLYDNTFSVKETQDVIRGHNVKLWQRRVSDDDFLTLPVGIGNMPMKLEIKYPEEHFTLEEDNLIQIARELGKKERILKDVPITYPFYQNIATGIIGDSIITKEFIDRVILQIMANYSYDEVKIVTFTSEDNEKDWDYIKVLPHSWSNDKSIRYFGSCNDDYREIIYSLEKIYNFNKESKSKSKNIPHYIIITDAIKSIDNYDFIKEVLSNEQNCGFNIIMLVDKISALPNECKNFINLSKQECSIFSSIINSDAQKFKIDFTPIDEIYTCAKELANIPIKIKNEVESNLPDVFHFLEMYQVGKVEQLNSQERWIKSNPILSLQAPVGIGKSGEIINLDLHEKYHGPHGLIAGTTGSGKSEFIITYILSLAINYHPYEVQIILIDYKGGSLAGAFSNDSYQLPHLAGTITNLDGNELNRSLASIESEVKRRQREFNKAKQLSNESTIDIYKYQKLWREGRLEGMNPIAHLFIISDEFAELKEQQPEFMDKLISIARVGRSLGIHLILATQKPGGVVDAQIWSNSRFKVCLKVQDTGDSQEVLKKPDAAYLKKTGRFYLQVGYDEVYTLGQSAWAGGQYYPNTTFKKDIDTSVNVINNIGYTIVTKDVNKVKKQESFGEELPNIVKYLCEIAKKNNISIKKLWLDKIPAKIYIDKIVEKYKFAKEPYYLNPIIGEYDDPASQNQFELHIPFSKCGNALIYGIAGSGKEQFLSSLIYSSMVSYNSKEVNFYILDFGSGVLRQYNNSPYVGGIVNSGEEDKINKLLKMIEVELENRKGLFANFGGNYQKYIKNGKDTLPNIVIIINNYEAFAENYEEQSEGLTQLTRDCFKYGIYFVITANNESAVRSRIKQNFALVYVLQQNDNLEYSNILGNCRGKEPLKVKGRGLFKKDKIYEFQTGLITEEDEGNYILEYCEKVKESNKFKAKKIPELPAVVDYEHIKDDIPNNDDIVIGINNDKLTPAKLTIDKNAINIISSNDIDNIFNFVNAIANQVLYKNKRELIFVNTTDKDLNNINLNTCTIEKGFDDLIKQTSSYIEEAYKIYESNDYQEQALKGKKKIIIIIFGVYNFINKLNDESKKALSSMIKKTNQMNIVNFIFIDTPDVLKGYVYEDWFKAGSDLSKGLWIGSGISDQTLFKIFRFTKEDRKEIPLDYGFIIKNGKISKVKLLDEFNLTEEL